MAAQQRTIVLVGLMGTGKTTVGKLLATSLGVPFFDSDEIIEARTGRTVREIFASDGEPVFRALETEALVDSLADPEPAVIAAAGGVVLAAENRRALRQSGAYVVWLRAEPGLLVGRVVAQGHRPLLDADPAGTLGAMQTTREPLYAEVADVALNVDLLTPDQVVAQVIACADHADSGPTTSPGTSVGPHAEEDLVEPITVEVQLGDRSYPVVVGPGASAELAALLPRTARRAVVVTQPGLPTVDPGLPHEVVEIGHGEQHKTLATVESLCRTFARVGLTRNDVVIGVGGGMVTDLAGFAAAVWHRGVPVVHVSTTLLGMVDAAIGGKTGANLPEGKNLVGAFWQPSGVICDLDHLATLPPREMRCGMGEMAKYHFLTGDELLAMPLAERVARCVQIKADVVASDEREGGRRAILNYGHTLAHALEIVTDHSLAHGEAVAVGLIYAAHLARVLGRIDDARVQQHYAVVGGAYELATALPPGLDPAELLMLMARDKKALDGLTFVLDGPDGVEVVAGVAEQAVRDALDAHTH